MKAINAIGIAGSKSNLGNLPAVAEETQQAESLGYSTLWIPGGQDDILPVLDRAVRASTNIRVASGIIGMDRANATDVAALYTDVQRDHPGRLLIGLGGAHGARPLKTAGGFLDELDSAGVPRGTRVLAALGPRMLALARDRAGG